jgi:hypothetical protein
MPAPASRRSKTSFVQLLLLRNRDHSGRSGRLNILNDRQDIDYEAICVRLLHAASKLAGLIDID